MIPCFIALYFSQDWHASGKKLVIKRWRFGLARGLIMSFAQLCLYTSYLYLPYALVATMEYTGPMMVTLLAIFFNSLFTMLLKLLLVLISVKVNTLLCFPQQFLNSISSAESTSLTLISFFLWNGRAPARASEGLNKLRMQKMDYFLICCLFDVLQCIG